MYSTYNLLLLLLGLHKACHKSRVVGDVIFDVSGWDSTIIRKHIK